MSPLFFMLFRFTTVCLWLSVISACYISVCISASDVALRICYLWKRRGGYLKKGKEKWIHGSSQKPKFMKQRMGSLFNSILLYLGLGLRHWDVVITLLTVVARVHLISCLLSDVFRQTVSCYNLICDLNTIHQLSSACIWNPKALLVRQAY